MKNINTKGFTLIELLAVITIMGILMLVAIPAVSRTIENSRKDTFIDTAKKYADSTKTMWAGDNLVCGTDEGKSYNSSAVPEGTYYVLIDTTNPSTPVLLEQGGKSSWGSRDIKGYVKVEIKGEQHLYGDLDGDKDVDDADLTLASELVADGGATSLQIKLGDFNGNGFIDSGDLIEISKLIGSTKYYNERTINFYPVIADGVHGINVDVSADDMIASEELVRGNLIMTGAEYDKVLLSGVNTCVER